jgi:hypothetical protein
MSPDKRAKTHTSGTYTSSSSVLRDQPTNAPNRPHLSATGKHKDTSMIISISSDSEFVPDNDGASSDIEVLHSAGPSEVQSNTNTSRRIDWKQVESEA